ncbi:MULTISPECIES: signal peptidase II [Shouchella]|uniref:Lipoprotein signal peptidase n=2 Tax=Shouchella TaxID=2893057 RepID=A0ABY7W880_9BACI|nr:MULTISPECIES: signal peptidase II [Shouchella]MED4127369.1 signal peptidase II [Shouchella miscanthi]WDF03839.1 signal peptidase II [Shouchella hunanensis]GAF22196.1 lipoprotein signal peptidase [Bacillus sp. JCM 19047]
MAYIIAIIIIGFDQLTKWLVVENMMLGERITVMENIFYIFSHRNSGAAFGILQGQMWLFYIITVVMVGVIIYLIQTEAKKHTLLKWALGLILGGAIGNFIDRLFRQEVVDFIDTFGNFPIFNIADSALTVGVGLFLINLLLESRREKKESKN